MDPLSFVHRSPPLKVVCRPGAVAALADELRELGVARPLVLTGPRTSRSPLYLGAAASLAGWPVATFTEVPPHSSVKTVERVRDLAREHRADVIVAIGGGSVSDTAKAAAILLAEGGELEQHASRFTPPATLHAPALAAPKLPIVAIPSTASAAEVTPGLGVRTPDGRKLIFSDPKVAARLIVIDPEANLAVPASLMLATGMNGLAHCLEGLYSTQRTPATTGLALHGLRLFSRALPALAASPDSMQARADVLVAAHLSGLVLLNARTCFHHAVCHAIGAMTGVGHGDANSVVLPHALAFNAPAATEELAAAAEAMGEARATANADAAVRLVARLQSALGVPTRLRDLGVAADVLPAVARKVLGERGLYFNPRRVHSADEVEAVLRAAW